MKQIIISNKIKNSKEYKSYTRNLKVNDVKKYFSKTIRPKLELNCKSHNYCWRCGRILMKGYIYKKGKYYKGFYLCPECYDHKVNNGLESTPDIEDIKRFGLEINFLI